MGVEIRVSFGNASPVWEESTQLSAIGKGCVIVLNVMSKHALTSDTVIGQVCEMDTTKCALRSTILIPTRYVL